MRLLPAASSRRLCSRKRELPSSLPVASLDIQRLRSRHSSGSILMLPSRRQPSHMQSSWPKHAERSCKQSGASGRVGWQSHVPIHVGSPQECARLQWLGRMDLSGARCFTPTILCQLKMLTGARGTPYSSVSSLLLSLNVLFLPSPGSQAPKIPREKAMHTFADGALRLLVDSIDASST